MAPGNEALDLFCAFLIWIPVTVGILAFIGWSIQGEIEPLYGFVGVVLALSLGGMCLVPSTRHLAPYMTVCAFLALVLVPYGRAQHERRELAKIDLDRVEKAYDTLRVDRKNIDARIKIAKVLYSRGYHAQAVILAEEALKNAPRALFEEELQMLKQWKIRPVPQPVPGITCIECGHRNKAGQPFCAKCRAPILLHYARGNWVPPSVFKSLLLIWIAGGVSIVGIPLAQHRLSPNKSSWAVVLLLCCSALIAWLALRKKREVSSF